MYLIRLPRIVLIFAAIATIGCAQREATSLGGAWELVDSGDHHPFLWRHSKSVHVLLERDTYGPKYIPDDCILYISLASGHLAAACGDRQPLILNADFDSIPDSSKQGFLDQDPLPIGEHERLSVKEIIQRALTQPALTNAWQMPGRR